MGKPRMMGMINRCIPNSKADMRRHKKVYQRDREKVFLSAREQRRDKEVQG